MENPPPESTTIEVQKEQKLFKVILLGEVGVGKTSLFIRMKDNEFKKDAPVTIANDNCSKIVNYKNQRITLSIWDTAGAERFRSLTKSYYRDANAIVLVYDVTRQETLAGVQKWQCDAAEYNPSAYQVLVGNKVDLISKDERIQGDRVSARTGEGVQKLLNDLAENLVTKFEKEPKNNLKNITVDLQDPRNNNDAKKKGSKCSC